MNQKSMLGSHARQVHDTTRRCRLLQFVPAVLAAIFTVFAAAQSPDLASLSAQAQAALKDPQYYRAVQAYEQIVKLDPRSAIAHSNLGLAFYMSSQYSKAIAEL